MTGGCTIVQLLLCLPGLTMNHTAELEKALTNSDILPGISMEIHAETEEEVTKALEQLSSLSSIQRKV